MPSVTHYAIEGRSTAFAAGATTLVFFLGMKAMERGLAGWWVAYATAAVLALHIFLFSALALLALPLYLSQLRATRSQWLRFSLASTSAAAACVPLALIVSGQRGQVAWISEPSIRSLAVMPREVWYPLHGSAAYAAVGWVMLIAGFLSFRWFVARRARGVGGISDTKAVSALLLGWLLVPVIVLFITSIIGPNVYTPRYLFTTAPALALLLGAGPSIVGRTGLKAAVAISLLLVFALPWWGQRQIDAKAPTALAAQAVDQIREPGDAVLFVRGQGHEWTRLARYAYPDAFQDVVDLNLGVPYYESETFMESDVPLADVSRQRLVGVMNVVVVLPQQPTSQGAEDVETLMASGFVTQSSIPAGEWRVERWRRR